MPSPVGHAIAGVAAGWLVRGRPGSRGPLRRDLLLFGSLGALPDIDLLFGAHSGPTHGLGAAILIGLLMWLTAATSIRRPVHRPPGRSSERPIGRSPDRRAVWLASACAGAYASHTLLDWLGSDTVAPIGIMALWPISRDFYESDLHVFMGVSRSYWDLERFWLANLWTLVRELLILVPVVLAVAWARRRSGG